jgi:hypothetical protein
VDQGNRQDEPARGSERSSPVTIYEAGGGEWRKEQQQRPWQRIAEALWRRRPSWEAWTAVGTVGVFVLGIWTLKVSNDAVERQLRLTAKELRLTREGNDIAKQGARAIITVSNFTGPSDVVEGRDFAEGRYDFPLALHNSGGGPAQDVGVTGEILLLPRMPPDTPFCVVNDPVALPSGAYGETVAAGADARTEFPRQLSRFAATQLNAGAWAVVVYGTITYRDVFGLPGWERFCREFGKTKQHWRSQLCGRCPARSG